MWILGLGLCPTPTPTLPARGREFVLRASFRTTPALLGVLWNTAMRSRRKAGTVRGCKAGTMQAVLFPSPLAGEGAPKGRMRGISPKAKMSIHPLTRAGFSPAHPLPQGEREESTLASVSSPHPELVEGGGRANSFVDRTLVDRQLMVRQAHHEEAALLLPNNRQHRRSVST